MSVLSSVKEIMTTATVSVTPETSLLEAVELLLSHDFSGLPVVDSSGTLVGILTDEDLIVKGSGIHLPTFLKLLRDFRIYKKDADPVSEEIQAILKLKVKNAMNTDPFVLAEGTSIMAAADAFAQHHRVNPIPIVDQKRKLVGVISRYDIIKLYSVPGEERDRHTNRRVLDMDVNEFVRNFVRQFTFVSRTRTRWWLVASMLFALIGFLIAFLIIIRISL